MASVLYYSYVVKTVEDDEEVYVCNTSNEDLLFSEYQDDARTYETYKEASAAANALNADHPNYHFYVDQIVQDTDILLY